MNNIPNLASVRLRPIWPVDESQRHDSLATLRNTIATYRARRRFRRDLERIARDNPHLIDDMGLTRWQVEAEIAKRFWQR